MSSDDTSVTEGPVPEDDAVAQAARRGLGTLAGASAGRAFSWPLVQMRARRVVRRRAAAVGAACAIVLAAGGVAVAMTNRDSGSHLNVAGTTTTPSTQATTTTAPDASSSAPPLSTGATGIASTTASPPPDSAPQVGDVSGKVTVNGRTEMITSPVLVGTGADVSAEVRNTSDHTIWTSSSLEPTAVATICTSNHAETSRSLWWMTNISTAPGASSARSGTFTPTDAYSGTVTCEVDIVTTDHVGTKFDTSAGGDEATATILGRCPNVLPAIFDVFAPPTTTVSDASTTTTTLPATTTVGP